MREGWDFPALGDGVFVGAGILLAVLSGHLRLGVHGFGIVVLAQSAWLIWVGGLLCREGETQPREFPYFLEGGTPNVLGVAGLAAGLKYVLEQGMARIHANEIELTERLWRRLDEMPEFEVFGHRDPARRVGTLSFRTEKLPAPEIGGILDQAFEVAVRPGLHCAPYIHRSLGTFPEGTVRVSPGPFSTEQDIDHLAQALAEIVS